MNSIMCRRQRGACGEAKQLWKAGTPGTNGEGTLVLAHGQNSSPQYSRRLCGGSGVRNHRSDCRWYTGKCSRMRRIADMAPGSTANIDV